MIELSDHLKLLPHGPEFRFIDRLLSLDPGATARQNSPQRDGTILRGHFPGEPILPGVLLVEAAGQPAGVVAQPSHRRRCPASN